MRQWMTLFEGKHFVGTCVNSFDEDGDCVVPQLPWSTVSDLGVADEEAMEISAEDFVKGADMDPRVEEAIAGHDIKFLVHDGNSGKKPWSDYTWQESLRECGQCAYSGVIPASALFVEALITQNDAPEHVGKPLLSFMATRTVSEDTKAPVDPAYGMIVTAKIGDEFDEKTHQFVRDPNGWRRLYNGVLLSDHLTNLDDYHARSISVPAPKSGDKIVSYVQIVGFPIGTKFLSLGGTPYYRAEGDNVRSNDVKHCKDFRLA
jgi:hypothetical protein